MKLTKMDTFIKYLLSELHDVTLNAIVLMRRQTKSSSSIKYYVNFRYFLYKPLSKPNLLYSDEMYFI